MLESQQSILDNQIAEKAKSKAKEAMSVTDKKTAIQQDVLAQLEIVQRRLGHINNDIGQVSKQNEEVKKGHAVEKEKLSKLQKIANDKYRLDLTKVDAYLPRTKDWHERKKRLEKEMNRRVTSQLAGKRRENSAMDVTYAKKKENLETLQEKLDLLKNRLKRRFGDAGRLIDKAKSLDKFNEASKLQEMNLKVSGLLEMNSSSMFLTQVGV